MDVFMDILLFIALAVMGLVIYCRTIIHDEDIKAMQKEQKKAQAEINRLENRVSTMSTRQSRHEDTETQATRLLQEQIALKMDAMDACKAMLRESWRNH